jgi:hypothetical protein
MTAHLAMATVFPADAAAQASFVDTWRVQVSRPGAGTIAEQSGVIGPEQTTVSVQISVTLESPCEMLSILVELSAGGEVWFRTQEAQEVCAGSGNELQPQELQFVRPQPTVAPGTISLVVEERQTASSSFRISYDGSDNLTWLAWVQEGNAGWLHLENSSGSVTSGQPQDVTVGVNTSGLSPGGYAAHVVVTGEGFPLPIGSVLVDLTVTPGPEIELYPLEGIYMTVLSGLDPDPQSFTVRNAGGGTLDWSASDNAGWMSVSPSSGSLAAGQTQEVTVSVTSANLEPGDYLGAITVRDPEAGNSPQIMPVNLTVTPHPKIELDPLEGIDITVFSGLNPDPRTFTVTNSGGGTLDWSATDDVGWMTVSPSSGSLGSGQSQDVTVSVTSASLETGNYQGTITVRDPEADNSPQTMPVNLTVRQRAMIGVEPTSLAFSALQGTNPWEQYIQLTNTGGSTLFWTATDDADWLSVVPHIGTLWYIEPGGGLSTQLTVNINSTDLAPGNYSATITFTDPQAGNSPQTVSVSLTVTPRTPPTISKLAYNLRTLNDETCGNSGSRFDIWFEYVDPDGDVQVSDGWFTGEPVELKWKFLPDGLSGEARFNTEVDGNGFSGTAIMDICIAYQFEGNTAVQETFRLRDGWGLWSNSETIIIPRPDGANTPPPASASSSGGKSPLLVGGGR